MIFVPLPLFACLALVCVLIWFVRTQDMTPRAHQLFAVLIALYAVQSLLITLRWGYDVQAVARVVAVLAPVLPVVAYLSYAALMRRLRGARFWPIGLVLSCWAALFITPDLADIPILLTYLGIGGVLIAMAWRGPDRVALSPLANARQVVAAMAITGATLVASALTDIYIIVDFIRNDGRSVGLVVGVLQTLFVLVVGLCAGFGRVSTLHTSDDSSAAVVSPNPTVEDAEILARIDQLFMGDGFHRTEELSLRRLSRRLSLPDRRVSNAINRLRGQSVSQYVNHHRIKDACTLLDTTDDSVLAVSLISGFATKSNFNREFSRVTGMSPSEWRATAGDRQGGAVKNDV